MARLNTDMVCTVATYFYEGVMLLLPVLCLVTSPCSGQEDTGSQPTRCVSLNNTISDLPGFCRRYYDDSEHLNGNIESDLQAQILIEINGIFQNDSYSLNLCIELIENYLCYYYFPLCNQTTGEITPVCKSSCTLLVNNADCFELIKITNWKLSQSNSLTIGNCLQTFRNYGSAPAVSENCLSIEDSLNESIPLICIEIQSKEICRRQLENSFYAPGTLDSTRQVFNEFQEIIRQLVDSCKDFISTLNCVLRFPACNETRGTIFPICHNICDFIDLTVNQCTSQELFRNNPEFSAVNQFLDTFECREPQSYYNFPAQYIETDPNICSGFLQGLPETMPTSTSTPTSTESNDESNNTTIIIGAVIGACIVVVVVIVLVITVLCVKRKNRMNKNFVGARHDSFNEYSEQPRRMRHRHVQDGDNICLDTNCTSNNEPSPYLTPFKSNLKEDDTMMASKASMEVLDINNFLDYVKNRFSEVLLPVNIITKQGLLGKGAFGVVHKGEMTSSDGTVKAVAIKTIKSESLEAMKDLVTESTIMKTFDHPNVLPLLGVCIDYDDEDILKIVMPFMANGDLKTFLKDSRVSPNNTHEYPKDLSEKIFLRMCFDIAKGMEYLASNRFIHRDLAARNCMVDKFLSIKIADFGLARDIYSTEYYRVDTHTTLPVKWMSLESLLDGFFDEKTDVWSYGITCWEIFSFGRIPYPGVDNANVITLLKTGYRLEQPELCPSNVNDIINTTWLEDPDDRPTFAMIVQNLNSICDFSEISTADELSIRDTDDTAESNDSVN